MECQYQLLPRFPGNKAILQQISCGNNAKVESQDINLDWFNGIDAGFWWMTNVSAWFIKEWIITWTAHTLEDIS